MRFISFLFGEAPNCSKLVAYHGGVQWWNDKDFSFILPYHHNSEGNTVLYLTASVTSYVADWDFTHKTCDKLIEYDT